MCMRIQNSPAGFKVPKKYVDHFLNAGFKRSRVRVSLGRVASDFLQRISDSEALLANLCIRWSYERDRELIM